MARLMDQETTAIEKIMCYTQRSQEEGAHYITQSVGAGVGALGHVGKKAESEWDGRNSEKHGRKPLL